MLLKLAEVAYMYVGQKDNSKSAAALGRGGISSTNVLVGAVISVILNKCYHTKFCLILCVLFL